MENHESLNAAVPEIIKEKVVISDIIENHTQTGKFSSYEIRLSLSEIDKYKQIKSNDFSVLYNKMCIELSKWEGLYQKYIDKLNLESKYASIEELNKKAEKSFEQLECILKQTLSIDDTIDWEKLKNYRKYEVKPFDILSEKEDLSFIEFENNGKPLCLNKVSFPEKPQYSDYLASHSFIRKFFFRRIIKSNFDKIEYDYKILCDEIDKKNENREELYQRLLVKYEAKKSIFEEKKFGENNNIEKLKRRYLQGEKYAIEEYCDLVLSNSEYPEYFPSNWEQEYREADRMIIVDFSLPSLNSLPKVEEYKYIKTRNEIKEKQMSESKRNKIYDNLIYQICIRTIHELFEADTINALDSITFNGIITAINPATGVMETKTIVSVSAQKKEFMTFDLSNVDPKETFKKLKGISAVKLADLVSIPPIISLDKNDKRVVEGYDVAKSLSNAVNLAAMDWEGFEHLVRQLFEQEFASNGGEVKVTQSSKDGGVDAIAWDPDPIRGGKIVIQAKRYTNAVSVSAVRDLHGTVLHEGATKGILVTTSNFGKDSYQWANGKPITLINGNNLLSLLEKHGHRARINISEAKQMIKK